MSAAVRDQRRGQRLPNRHCQERSAVVSGNDRKALKSCTFSDPFARVWNGWRKSGSQEVRGSSPSPPPESPDQGVQDVGAIEMAAG